MSEETKEQKEAKLKALIKSKLEAMLCKSYGVKKFDDITVRAFRITKEFTYEPEEE